MISDMTRVFFSYSRADLDTVKRLEQLLVANKISVWRDEESLYGGQHWPKAIGEAIASNDALLLIWSKNSAESHFVEFEWTIAIALRKTIIPCLIDNTPLEASLSGITFISLKDFDSAVVAILRALEMRTEKAAPWHYADVVEKLGQINLIEPESALRKAKALFAQEGWYVKGSVYQTVGAINLTINETARHNNWMALGIVPVVILLITGLFFILDNGLKINSSQTGRNESAVQNRNDAIEDNTTYLRGRVVNSNGEPLADATVELDELPGQSFKTTSDGGFYIDKIPGKTGDRARVYVRKEGYQNKNKYIVLPGPERITLEK